MDITVSIVDHKSLSQSELSLRRLYTMLQIGRDQELGDEVIVRGAKFHSGSMENPLILTIKNSQTETVMYQRNIPISAVPERGGLFEQWVAVYAPGDPQNLHFDVNVKPTEGCPQVCISITILEEPTGFSSFIAGSQSFGGFAPTAWELPRAASRPETFDAPTAWELPRAASRPETFDASALVPSSSSTQDAVPNLDTTLKRTALKAKQMKEQLALMANEQRREKGTQKTLQENTRIFEDLKRQLQNLEQQIVEQKTATEYLEQDRDQLLEEEARLQESIQQRNITFQEMRTAGDEIDRELSRALGEGERQKSAMESSSRDFATQKENLANELEQSRNQVQGLRATLKQKEESLAERQSRAREEEARHADQESSALEQTMSVLDKTRVEVSMAKATYEEQQLEYKRLQIKHQEVQAQIKRQEVQAHLSTIEEDEDEDGLGEGLDLASDVKFKKQKIEAQANKARKLEQALRENKDELDRMSSKMAGLREEAHEKEMAAHQCEEARLELMRQLEDRQRNHALAAEQSCAYADKLIRAEEEATKAREALDLVHEEVIGSHVYSKETRALEDEIQAKRDKLADARAEADLLQNFCSDLETTNQGSRQVLKDRRRAAEALKTQIVELERHASETAHAHANNEEELQDLKQQVEVKMARLQDTKISLSEKQQHLQMLMEGTQRVVQTGTGRISELDQTAKAVKSDLAKVRESKSLAAMRCSELEGFLLEANHALTELQAQIDELLSAKEAGEKDVKTLMQENQAAVDQLQRGRARLARLEQATHARDADLESTKDQISAKMREVAELEMEHCREVERMEVEAALLASEHSEKSKANDKLTDELKTLRAACDTFQESVGSSEREHQMLEAKLENFLARKEMLQAEHQDKLSQTEMLVQEATVRAQLGAERKEKAEKQLHEAQKRRCFATTKLDTIKEEVEMEEGKLHEAQAQLHMKKASLESIHAELDQQQTEASRIKSMGSTLESEVEDLSTRLSVVSQDAAELEQLEKRYAELEAEQRQDAERHREMISHREKEMEETRSQLQRRGAEALQRKEEEICRQMDQITKLEAEKQHLNQTVERIDSEKGSMEETFSRHEREQQDALSKTHSLANECVALEAAVRWTRSVCTRLVQRDKDLEQLLHEASERESASQQESREAGVRLEHLQGEMRKEISDAESQIEAEAQLLEVHCEALAKAEQQTKDLTLELEAIQTETAALLRQCEAADVKVQEQNNLLHQLKTEMQSVTVETEAQNKIAMERSQKVACYASKRAKSANTKDDLQVLRRNVTELETMLRHLSDKLVDSQHVVRRKRAEEEEIRSDIQRLRESIRSTNDKISYHVENGNLQFEIIEQLEEQKKQFEEEVEVLRLGLHDVEQRNKMLQKANSVIQQQVEGHNKGHFQDLAEVQRVKVAAEVAHCNKDIDKWKNKAKSLRKSLRRDKQQELIKLQRQHEEKVKHLRERIVQAQAEIEQCDTATKKREAALSRTAATAGSDVRRGSVKQSGGDAPSAALSGALPGLIVPQRPLPTGSHRRKALLIGINYTSSHVPLKGCVNDVWNLHCLLRYTLQYTEDQFQLFLDCADGRPSKSKPAPTKANILTGLQWLFSGAQPSDNLLLVFCGYGAQHPCTPGSDLNEAYLVPSDFAADLPSDFFNTVPGRDPTPVDTGGDGYRLISMLEIHDYISRLPATCRMTVVFDCCYSLLPSVNPQSNFLPAFSKVKRGQVDYAKLRDFISRPRFLELPVLPVQHTPKHLHVHSFPSCRLHCFSGCKLDEWCAEFPIEGTVQGAFSWAFLNSMARGHFHCGVYQFQQMLSNMLSDLKVRFKGVHQTPQLQLSQAASMQDIILWT